MTIYFIRHGIDDEGYRGGWSQRGLITEGYRQSEKLGCYLKDNHSRFNIGRIVSSDLQRALDTAGEIGRELRLTVEHNGVWRELNNGAVAGLPGEIADERYPGLYFAGLQMDERYAGGESPREFYTRIHEAFYRLCAEITQETQAENTAVVTHGGVINVIYHLVNGREWTNRSRKYPSAYTSLHQLEYCNGAWMFTAENVTEHL